jgi:hypothetical protein
MELATFVNRCLAWKAAKHRECMWLTGTLAAKRHADKKKGEAVARFPSTSVF